MKTLLIFFLLTIIMNLRASSQQGKLINEGTKLPIDGATVLVRPSGQTVVTNESGNFSFGSFSKEIDSIYISAIGYQSRWIHAFEFKNNRGMISVPRAAVDLATVSIITNPGEQFKPISQLDIRMRPINNSQMVLPMVPGLFIGQHAGGGKAEQIFLRGFDLDHGTDINISVDGTPVNMVSHAHGQGYADLHFVIPELIGDVDFQKGCYFADKGDLTTAGFVDFHTTNVLKNNMVKLEAGQFNTFRSVAMMNLLKDDMIKKGQSAFIASELMYTDGYFDHPQDFNRFNLFGKYFGKIDANNQLMVSLSTFSSKWNASGQIPERALREGLITFFGAIDPNEGGKTSRQNMNIILSSDLKNGGLLKNQVYLTSYDFELYSNFTFFSKDSINGDQIRQKERRILSGYNGSLTLPGFIGANKIVTEIGVNTRFDKTDGSELSRTKQKNVLTAAIKLGNVDQLNVAAYIKETVRLTDRLDVIAGLRTDHFYFRYQDALAGNKISEKTSAAFSPKINFYYKANKSTQFYFSAGKGFHSNDARVSVQSEGRDILPAVYGSDIGVIWKPSPSLLLNSSLWYLHLDQEFVYVGDEGVVEPSGRSRRFGIDVSARYQPIKNIFIDIDGNYSHGRSVDDPKGENYLPLAPRLTSAGGVTYKLKNGFEAGIRYRLMGTRPANENNAVVAKGYFINDMVVKYGRPKFDIDLAIVNILNKRWKETQFDTESRLQNEPFPISEIHFTPGTPFFLKVSFTYFFKY